MAYQRQSEVRQLLVQVRTLHWLRWFLAPVLVLFAPRKGIPLLKDLFIKFPKLKRNLENMVKIPDDFNRIFIKHGWVAAGNLKLDAMEMALSLHAKHGLEKAEQHLEDHFNNNLEHYKEWLLFLRSVQQRTEIITLAVEDHKAGRYHASVPVFLAQIDGLSFELTGKDFFERGRPGHLKANETIAGDWEGLPAIAAQLSIPRGATSSEAIRLPYRHGILHGRDLGYASRRVSTKAFALLVSMREWIIACENKRQFKAPADFYDPEFGDPKKAAHYVKRDWEAIKKLLLKRR